MGFEAWLVFVGVWFLSGIPLGPNAINCIAVSSQAGFLRSLWCVVGIIIAGLVFIALVSVGFATILAAHAGLFTALKVAGALYLIWMGLSAWRKAGRPADTDAAGDGAQSASRIVVRSIGISLSNPKAVLSYAAVFAQFISADAPLFDQLAILTPTAMGIVAIIYTAYCAAGVGIARVLSSARRKLAFDRFVAGFFVFAGTSLIANEAVRRA
ncbi:MAG: LysE family translocator [Alphaproteobacteria bacterium]